LSPAEVKHLEGTPLLTMKPCLFVANLDEFEFHGGPHYAALKALAEARHWPLVPILGDLEAELQAFSSEERQEFLTGVGLTETGIARLVRESSRLMGLVTFYTIVGSEVRAWHVPAGTAAPKAAGQVHSDMEQGFIRAEVMPFAALDQWGTTARVKEAGLLRVEGRDYLVADGDILWFRFQR
jgi:ribosome-binding ATPase YchF (GTP1/OBG family)